MEITTLLEYSERSQLRAWLNDNHSKEKECWVVISKSKTLPAGVLPYIDVVEEWIRIRTSMARRHRHICRSTDPGLRLPEALRRTYSSVVGK